MSRIQPGYLTDDWQVNSNRGTRYRNLRVVFSSFVGALQARFRPIAVQDGSQDVIVFMGTDTELLVSCPPDFQMRIEATVCTGGFVDVDYFNPEYNYKRGLVASTLLNQNLINKDVSDFKTAVIANSGTVSDARLALLDAFVTAEKQLGTWQLTDDYWFFAAENAGQALVSLKQRRVVVLTGTPTVTTDRDITFDGVAQLANLGFIPGTHAVALTASSQRMDVYERTNVVGSGTVSAGALTGATNKMFQANQAASGNLLSGLNTSVGTPGNFLISPADSRGLKATSRANGGTTISGWDRGVRKLDATGLTVSNAALPTHALFAGGLNNAGSLSNARNAAIAFISVGASFSSDAQEAGRYTNVQTLLTTIGAAV